MPRRKGSSLTRTDVIAAALACIEKEGVAGLGINRVARELGIQPPSLYNHVSSHDDLRQAVAIEGWRQLVARLEDLTDHQDPNSIMRGIAYTYRQFAHENPSLYSVMADTTLDADAPEFRAILKSNSDFYTRCLRAFGVDSEQMMFAVQCFWSAFHGFIELEQTRWVPQASMDESFEWLLNLLIKSIQTLPKSELSV